jgi:hypothetical protein|tara:strand:- start:1592 stop:2257 length:666 start_codon:yes stop_codon:yes gene_type:complete
MGSSGTTDFNLSIDEVVEEAFERCGMQMTAGYQLKSATRSLNLLFLDWANRGLNLWTIESATHALVKGDKEVAPGEDTVNVLSAVIRETTNGQQQDVSISRISRSEYLNVPNKLSEARPTQYYVQRTITPTIFLWPAADKAYTLVYYRIKRIEDAGAYTNTTDVNFRFLPCLASGLAYMLSLKYAADRTAPLKQIYEEDFLRAANEDRDTASVHFVPSVGQ